MSSNQQPLPTFSEITFICSCKRKFATAGFLTRHARYQHRILVQSFKLSLAVDEEQYQIKESVPVEEGKIELQDSEDDELPVKGTKMKIQQMGGHSLLMPIQQIIQQIHDPPQEIASEPIPLAEALIPEAKDSSEPYSEKDDKMDQSVKEIKKRGRPRQSRGFQWRMKEEQADEKGSKYCVNCFNSRLASTYSLRHIDFKQCIREGEVSRLNRLISRYIASWGIRDKSYFNATLFAEVRDRLIILNTLLQCEQAYLKWKQIQEIPIGNYVAFFNYFIVEFLPCLLREKDTHDWMQEYQTNVLTRKNIVLKEVTNFLQWWRRNDHSCTDVHRNPAFDITAVLEAESEEGSEKKEVKVDVEVDEVEEKKMNDE